MGLHRAGFEVVGVDLKPQPHYPFEFHQADAMTFPLKGFDAYWASPPCQKFTALKTMHNAKEYPDLLTPTRERLLATGLPYIMENVPGAPLAGAYIILCGTMFGLGVGDAELRRHRLFEVAGFYILTPQCSHLQQPGRTRTIGVYGTGNGRDYRRKPASIKDKTLNFSVAQYCEAMGIDWMIGRELNQAVPPAYSDYIGRELMKVIGPKRDPGDG